MRSVHHHVLRHAALALGAIALLATGAFAQGTDGAAPANLLEAPDAPVRGVAEAPVTLVAFTDFENPACGSLAVVLHGLADLFPEQLRIVFRHHVPEGRDRSIAHEAALAAAAQGRFWEMHDLLLGNQGRHSPAELQAMAAQLGLDVAAFSAALASGELRARVDQDRAVARQLGIRTAPVLFVQGERYSGARTLTELRQAIEQHLPADR